METVGLFSIDGMGMLALGFVSAGSSGIFLHTVHKAFIAVEFDFCNVYV